MQPCQTKAAPPGQEFSYRSIINIDKTQGSEDTHLGPVSIELVTNTTGLNTLAVILK